MHPGDEMTPGFLDDEGGVSEVVGEMLMIGLAILLIAVFSSILGNFLPDHQDPSVTIMMTNDDRGNITLWHKGGDWVKQEDLAVIFGNDSFRISIPSTDPRFLSVPEKDVFDLGSNITVVTGFAFAGDESISLVTPRAKIFSGRVRV